jgi:hemoglobin
MLSAEQIDAVVGKFYAAVRQDADLGPVFANHITKWPEHEAKIASFWRNAILRERSYSGNPMQKHQVAGDVKPEHFPIWLGLFDTVLHAELEPHLAHEWSRLAHRIGQGLSYGLSAQSDGTPKF